MIRGKQQLTSCTEDGEGEGARLLYVLAGRTSREAREFSQSVEIVLHIYHGRSLLT